VGNVLTSVPIAPNQERVALPLSDRLPVGIYLISGVGEDERGVWSRRVMVR